MATELKLPDMGEGVDDVTISAWRVAEGDTVNEGDVILEVATDKVDTEVPAPAGGTVLKLLFGEGEIADMNAVLAVIGEPGEETGSPDETVTASAEESASGTIASVDPNDAGPKADVPPTNGAKASPVAIRVANDQAVALENVTGTGPGGRITKADVLAAAKGEGSGEAIGLPGELADVASLAVTRVAAQESLDLNAVAAGRPLSTLTRYDVMDAVAKRDGQSRDAQRYLAPSGWQQAVGDQAVSSTPAQEQSKPPTSVGERSRVRPDSVAEGDHLIKHSRMRLAVARTTSESAFTAPHVTTMWDVNMSAVLAHRKAHKAEFATAGVNLTVTAYLIAAIVDGLKAVPAANATWTDEGVLIKRSYNVGMAVALPADEYGMGGLIVPVIRDAGDLNLMGLARAVNDFASKARSGELSAADLADGTFTLSNYGTSGSRFQTPIIVQPQVGILGVGAIEKRPVVISQGHPLEANTGDHMAFLPMTTLGFSYDHRVLDGATADAFCKTVKGSLEAWA